MPVYRGRVSATTSEGLVWVRISQNVVYGYMDHSLQSPGCLLKGRLLAPLQIYKIRIHGSKAQESMCSMKPQAILLLFFFCHAHSMKKLPGQRSNLHHSSDLSPCSDNARSLIPCTKENAQVILKPGTRLLNLSQL